MSSLMVVKVIIITLIYFLNYYLWGMLITHFTKRTDAHIFMILPAGFFIYGLIFFVIVFPLKVIGTSLMVVVYTWVVFWLISTIGIVFLCRKDLRYRISRLGKSFSGETIVWLIITGIQIIYESVFGRYTNGGGGIYYNSYVATEVFTNTLDCYSGLTGEKVSEHNLMYFLQTYLEHSAVVCKLTGIPALIEARQMMSIIVIILTSMIVFELGRTIFKNKRYALYFWIMYEASVGIMAQCVYIPAYHLYYRAFEGKAIFGMIVIPFMLTLFWRLYDDATDIFALIIMVLGLFGSLTYCMATMYVIPFLLVGYFPICVLQRSKRQLINWSLCWLPCIVASLYFVGAMKGIIDLTVRG